jgi:ATP/maltotriose-dependent transcriptional regulator MalT
VVAIGELDLEAGDAVGAADAAERVLRRLEQGDVLERFPALELLARARAATGEHDASAAAVAALERAVTGLGTSYMRARAHLVAAEALLAAGDADHARRMAEDAVDLFEDCSAPYEAARARLVLSAALAALDRSAHAAAAAKAAREALALLGARHDGAAAGDALSPRELDVLRLVANGLSDAEIAERLFLSPHTVHRHVANARTKLRLPSRAAAVAYATRAGLL